MILSQLIDKWLKELTDGHYYVDVPYVKCKCQSGWAVSINDEKAICIVPDITKVEKADCNWLRSVSATDPNLFNLIEARMVSIHSANLKEPAPLRLRQMVEGGKVSEVIEYGRSS